MSDTGEPTKASRVEDAFGAWLDARPAKTSRYDAPDDGTYQSVAADGKAVTLDGKFSVAALRELLRLIDQEFGNG